MSKLLYSVNEKECEAAGLDIKKVESIARRLSKVAMEAKEMGLEIFGGSGVGELRFRDDDVKGQLKVAYLDGDFDGGDGGQEEWGDDLIRGE